MPDSPDYQKYLPNSNRFSLQDMGELAARLGSVTHFDRRGEIVFYDTFDNGLGGWIVASSGAGASVSLVANHNYRYPYVCRLICGTSGNRHATIQKRLGGIETRRVGIEYMLAINLADYLIQFQTHVNDGINDYSIYLQFDGSNNQWSILNDGATYTLVATAPLEVGSAYLYVPIKIVADLELGKYIRLLINNVEYDISSVNLLSQITSTAINYSVAVANYGDGSTLTELYLAHIIITANEP